MIGDSIAVTYNSVAKTLQKINQDNYGAEYFLDDVATSGIRFTLTVKHTIPARGAFGESHVMKLKCEFVNATTFLIDRTCSSWGVLRTDDGLQDLTSSQRVQAALLTALTAGNTTKMLGRES